MKEMKLSDIMSENAKLGESLKRTRFEISILSNIVTTQLNEILEYLLRTNGIYAFITPGDYDNIIQESGNVQIPDLTLIFWEVGNLIDGLHFKLQNFPKEKVEDLLQKTKSEIDMVLDNLKTHPRVFINRFSVSLFTDEYISNHRLKIFCDDLNNYLESIIPTTFHIIDIERIFRRITLENSVDWRYFYLYKALYSIEFYKEYSLSILSVILGTLGKAKKVLVLDCDNTLWKGVLGEDGLSGIEYSSQTKSGVYFEEIQNTVVKLAYEGVVVCLVSKNNEKDVAEVFQTKTDMVLKENHIVIKKVNWKNKASNIREIAMELNLGLDSFVFVDDSDFEINLVKEQIPEVTCYQVPKRLHEYPSMMRELSQLFYKENTSSEDRNRVSLYKQEKARDSEKKGFQNIEDYLKSLELRLTITKNDNTSIDRVAQLTQKTNQFNLTTKRYTNIEIESFVSHVNTDVYAFSLADKFGDYGLTGVAIVNINNGQAEFDSFLMSCRILGRNIELVFINHVLEYLKGKSICRVSAKYSRTEKNNQVQNFFDFFGFQIINSTEDSKEYILELDKYNFKRIEYIEVSNGRPS